MANFLTQISWIIVNLRVELQAAQRNHFKLSFCFSNIGQQSDCRQSRTSMFVLKFYHYFIVVNIISVNQPPGDQLVTAFYERESPMLRGIDYLGTAVVRHLSKPIFFILSENVSVDSYYVVQKVTNTQGMHYISANMLHSLNAQQKWAYPDLIHKLNFMEVRYPQLIFLTDQRICQVS